MVVLPMTPAGWDQAALALRRGQLVAFPTDTVYGIACDPHDVGAIELLYSAKGRDREKAIPLLLSGVSILGSIAREVPESARRLGQEFWPGALTLVVPRREELPRELSGSDTVAIRVPAHAELLAFLARCGGALATTSANLSGHRDAVTAEQVVDYFGERVAVVIDGGPSPGGIPSTVVNCAVQPPVVLREGAIAAGRLQAVIAGAGN